MLKKYCIKGCILQVIERVAVPPSDLSPSPGVESLLNLLKELLSVAPVSESQHYYLNKVLIFNRIFKHKVMIDCGIT